MTLNDLLKRVKPDDYSKVIVFNDGVGWTNIGKMVTDGSTITLYADRNEIFSDDKK